MDDAPLNTDAFKVGGVREVVTRLPKYFTISVASKRNSGKTVLVSEIIRTLLREGRVDVCLVMSGSARLNTDYGFLPKRLVMPFSAPYLEAVWESQAAKPAKERPHVLIVLDDALATPEAIRATIITRYFSLGRHISTSFIVISQHTAVLLSPIIKANSDVILWSKLNRAQLEELWGSTTNVSRRDFIRVSEAHGGVDHQFMLLDNFVGSNDPAKFLAVVKARPPAE